MATAARGKPGPKPRGLAEAPPIRPVVEGRVEEAIQPFLNILSIRKPGTQLTEVERRAAVELLAVFDGNIGRVSALTGLAKSFLLRLKFGAEGEFENRRAEWKKAVALETQDIVTDLAARIREDVPNMHGRDAAVALGILVDKGAILSGETTSNVRVDIHHHLPMEQLQALQGASMDRLSGMKRVEQLEIDEDD